MAQFPFSFKRLAAQKTAIITSMIEGSEAFLLAEAYTALEQTIVFITPHANGMNRIANTLKIIAPQIPLLLFPGWDCQPYDRVSPHSSLISQRLTVLSELLLHSSASLPRIILTTVNGLMQKVIPQEILYETIFQAKAGDTLNREALITALISNGYSRAETANEPGEFALRGSVIDIIENSEGEGIRLDFFGNTLESIRAFDPLSQISHGKRNVFTLIPANEIILNATTIEHFRQNYRLLSSEFPSVKASRNDPLYEAISSGRRYPGYEHWMPLFYNKLESLFDYLSHYTVIYDHHAEHQFHERRERITSYYEARCETLRSQDSSVEMVPYYPVSIHSFFFSSEEWQQKLQQRPLFTLSRFNQVENEVTFSSDIIAGKNYALQASTTHQSVFTVLQEELTSLLQQSPNQLKIVICCVSEGSRDRLKRMLEEHEFPVRMISTWNEIKELQRTVLGLIVLPIEQGFRIQNLILISEQDVLGEKIARASASRIKKVENFLSEAASLEAGEFVVHKDHGIGQFEGLETLYVSGIPHDCLRILYEGGDKLYIPVENIEVISRYGSEEVGRLDKLGSNAWQSRKAKLKQRIKLAAEVLLKTAAERSLHVAPIMTPVKGLYEEFCARFPYAETDDQLSSIEEIQKDLASGAPMDRLICGDVGFGKTEVALRAAFMASFAEQNWEHSASDSTDLAEIISSSKHRYQVAVITPTTLLCKQHYQTFMTRFKGFPVRVRQLSRLSSTQEAAKTRKLIAEGEVDIVIGTHALLAKSIQFNNLGLLIVDEEQHFGVAQKERLKQMRSNIHVLTLSATPIPRTLQMSLSGIREMSLIATPPVDRLAIRTYVMPFDPITVREAIMREYQRGGRTFYVCPRIKDLEEIHQTLKELIPEIKIVIAHGQMAPDSLDDIMNAFYEGQHDLLLSTTIIESGLDVPAANTLIIHRADMFGLSQLYQIRGRVGRGKLRAYAYLTIPPNKILTKTAQKRLSVMQTLDSLGAGFSLASHDMDIRGFGNLVGDEQSGHIKEVGIELYQDMLKEAVETLKREHSQQNYELSPASTQESWSPQINVGLSILIPESYIPDLALRMGLYRRIALLTQQDEVEAFAAEMIDRFGSLPEETQHLLEVVKIKQLCKAANIEKIDVGPKGMVITFYQNTFPNPEGLLQFITLHPAVAKLRADQKLVLMNESKDLEQRLKWIYQSLKTLINIIHASSKAA